MVWWGYEPVGVPQVKEVDGPLDDCSDAAAMNVDGFCDAGCVGWTGGMGGLLSCGSGTWAGVGYVGAFDVTSVVKFASTRACTSIQSDSLTDLL